MENKTPRESLNLAGRDYNPDDYKRKDELSSGLARTHEQVSDAYAEGEINPVIDNVNGKDIPVERKGYE